MPSGEALFLQPRLGAPDNTRTPAAAGNARSPDAGHGRFAAHVESDSHARDTPNLLARYAQRPHAPGPQTPWPQSIQAACLSFPRAYPPETRDAPKRRARRRQPFWGQRPAANAGSRVPQPAEDRPENAARAARRSADWSTRAAPLECAGPSGSPVHLRE